MSQGFEYENMEHGSCGVGFIASRKAISNHAHLEQALHALTTMEYRGACAADKKTSDGAGLMTDIPFELFGFQKGEMAVATLFLPSDAELRRFILKVFGDVFETHNMQIRHLREVPIDTSVLGEEALESLPTIMHAFISRPEHCRTDASYNQLLFKARQGVRNATRSIGIAGQYFFTSVSSNTIIYKALTLAEDLDKFYLDLQNPKFKTRFALFHRRFSTNTKTSWDKAQPFRFIAHNGEINTIAGNRSWATSREKSLGLIPNELITRYGVSDSGNLNEMVEALHHLSSIPKIQDILAIMIPPADHDNTYYRFWRRAMEPWDGPASVCFSDGHTVGARLDRNGFRPARWAKTEDYFYLCSDAGAFKIEEEEVLEKGALLAGTGVTVDLESGKVEFKDPSDAIENQGVDFDPRLIQPQLVEISSDKNSLDKKNLFGITEEDMSRMLLPMIQTGKEPIGSMGDTARLAIFSEEPRSFFDYFYQRFAQVTNPPVDYIRERMVTNLRTTLGRRPNIFAPKELIPPPVGLEFQSPVLSLSNMAYIRSYMDKSDEETLFHIREYKMLFRRDEGAIGFRNALDEVARDVVSAVTKGANIIILSDEGADYNHPPIPSLLMLRTVVNALNEAGTRLEASIVIHSGEIKDTHQLSALIGFGAAAVCPYMALEIARMEPAVLQSCTNPEENEAKVIKAFETGILKVMAKMGISVLRSYQSAKLFTAIGLGEELIQEFFPGLDSLFGGIEIKDLAEDILKRVTLAETLDSEQKLGNTYLLKEHNKGTEGEKHYMTSRRTKLVHKLVRDENFSPDPEHPLYQEYLEITEKDEPISLRHAFDLSDASEAITLKKVEPAEDILKRFGTGGMSFGAISAESQRDLILAMQTIKGRSNSGEGGENPFYFNEGVTSTIKQVASGRFGVTAEYLMAAKEIQIKISQGAKPGEGGQLMSVKVDVEIAKARHALPGIELISPPPMHDIYSIEDLKELIYELRQLQPDVKVNVKLTSGEGIGTVAVGVVKAGADSIHISGGDGGTGAATLTSMRHAGLPWEIGLNKVHRALVENNLRQTVVLRADGGLSTGKDIIIAALLGADEYDFGKLLLIAEGCIMARICEKNTCPTGIATHDPKFKAKYKGQPEHVVRMMQILAEDVRRHLAKLGAEKLSDIIGRTDLLRASERHIEIITKRKMDFRFFFNKPKHQSGAFATAFNEGLNALNESIATKTKEIIEKDQSIKLAYTIKTTDRAVPATLAGLISLKGSKYAEAKKVFNNQETPFKGSVQIDFTGSAGQGFGVFMVSGMNIRLYGEANDSVCKSMSGGKMVIRPSLKTKFVPEKNTIIGNCALYGATGGKLLVNGLAGDRFAVRNSGATAVVEGVGLHACEYMTNGTVVILGKVSYNLGAGMTGGELFLYGDEQEDYINREYISSLPLNEEDETRLKSILDEYVNETQSNSAEFILMHWPTTKHNFRRYVPNAMI